MPHNQPLIDEASARHSLAKKRQQLPPEAAPVAAVPSIENQKLQDAEVDRICLENAEACVETHKTVMPDMLRLEGCIARWGRCA